MSLLLSSRFPRFQAPESVCPVCCCATWKYVEGDATVTPQARHLLLGMAFWSAPLCQILLLVLGCRLAGPSRKGPSRTSASLLAVAVTLLQDFYCTLSQPCREFQPHLANQCKVRLIPLSPDQTWFILHEKCMPD